MSTCIFCHKDSSLSKSVEHIIPESLGNKHHFLPRGYVCDTCNHYFAVKIEQYLLALPYFVSMRFRNEILTKKGKRVKERMIFPPFPEPVEVVLQITDGVLDVSFDNEELYEQIETNNIKEMIGLYIPEPEYPNKIMSRFVTKCAYEYFLYNVGEKKYDACIKDLLGPENDILKSLREYARYGKGEYWQYSQRRIASEGELVYNPEENMIYERLHQMTFFIKEHEHLQNDCVRAEIYFVMDIAGIEYAICISDPNISGYIQWVSEHENQSPLDDKKERNLFTSLSDVNPLLIKKDSLPIV